MEHTQPTLQENWGIPMRLSELINTMTEEGYCVTRARIRSALRGGYVRPTPTKGYRGAYDFEQQHLEQIRWYCVHIRPGPQPRQFQELPICGHSDRINRLERKREICNRRLKLEREKEMKEKAFWDYVDRLEAQCSNL
jgi:hypothetical protein